MGKFYLFHLAYNGYKKYGWQCQPGLPTVEGHFLQCASQLFPSGRMMCRSAGRTDAGVHALGQVVKTLLPVRRGPEILKEELNQLLGEALQITQARRIPPSFKVSHLVTEKEYWYIFKEHRDVLAPFPFLPEGVCLKKMREGAQVFEGKHNFVNFQHRSTVKGDFEREIFKCAIVPLQKLIFQVDFFDQKGVYVLQVKGRGFLKQQIRIMLGALCRLGTGEIELEQLQQSLRLLGKKVGFIAPPEGLFLKSVHYPPWSEGPFESVVDKEAWREHWPGLEMWRDGLPVEITPRSRVKG